MAPLFAPFFCRGAENALFGAIWDKFSLNLMQFLHGHNNQIEKNGPATIPSKGAIWDEFSEYHLGTKA